MGNLRAVKYRRHEFRHKPTACEGSLLTFVYDVPYFDACGVFPPFHIINQILSSGGGDGGMSPGASWKPFTISTDEYEELAEAVRHTPVSEIRPHARYAWLQMKFDVEFDHLTDRIEWMRAVCEKHRDAWHAELEKSSDPA
jgi:hypothetical protein